MPPARRYPWGVNRPKHPWWESTSPARSFVLGGIFLGVIVVAALEPLLRADALRFAGLVAVAAIAAGAQFASAIATLVSRRRRAVNAERPDSV